MSVGNPCEKPSYLGEKSYIIANLSVNFYKKLFLAMDNTYTLLNEKYGGLNEVQKKCVEDIRDNLDRILKGDTEIEEPKDIDVSNRERLNEDIGNEEGIEINKNIKILLFSDNYPYIKILNEHFSKDNINKFVCVKDLKESKDIIKNKFDLILVDVNLPISDRFELIKLAENGVNKNSKIIGIKSMQLNDGHKENNNSLMDENSKQFSCYNEILGIIAELYPSNIDKIS